jgi:hypothetical protein
MNSPLSHHERLTIPRIRKHRRLNVLSRREALVVQSLAETIFPQQGSGMPTVSEAQVVEYVDDLLSRLELKEKVLVRCLITLLEVQMVAFNGLRPKLFSKASEEERIANLKGWEKSNIFQRRMVFMAIRTLLLWAYVDSHEAERDMGFLPGTRAIERRNQVRHLAHDTLARLGAKESMVQHA